MTRVRVGPSAGMRKIALKMMGMRKMVMKMNKKELQMEMEDEDGKKKHNLVCSRKSLVALEEITCGEVNSKQAVC